MPTETPSEPPRPAAIASARNTESPTKEQPPALTASLYEAVHDATNTKKLTGMMDRDGDGNTALSSDQVSSINKDVSWIDEVVSSNRPGDVNVTEGVMEVDQEGGAECRYCN